MSRLTEQTVDIHTIEEALAALGVTHDSLNAQEKERLDVLGYVVLEDVLSDRLDDLRRLFDQRVAEQRPGAADPKETGTRHIKDLQRTEAFWRVCLHPRVLAAVFHVLHRRFVCSPPHGREPLQGFGQQGLHMDWTTGRIDGVSYVATAICLLDDFTAENGATRVVPGSHTYAKPPAKAIADPAYVHPQQVVVTAQAGSVLFFNGHLLHSGARNRSQLRRRTLQFSYTAHGSGIYFEAGDDRPSPTDPAAQFIFGTS
jgi:ectoine hydroxylase-related dioxygenase (phytanoyl-CoA dioxygenase family)